MGDNSSFDKKRTWLLLLISARLALVPIDRFILPLIVKPSAYLDYLLDVTFDPITLFITLIPLVWLFPLYGIWQKKRFGYTSAMILASLLIILNIFGGFVFLLSPGFYSLSFIYALTGILIIILAVTSLKHLSVETRVPLNIDENKARGVPLMIALTFTFAVIFPGIMSYFICEGFCSPGNNITGYILGAFIGFASGLVCAINILRRIKDGHRWAGAAFLYGGIAGTAAQFPIYGLVMDNDAFILLVYLFALPIGGIIGALLGLIGVNAIYFITKSFIVFKEAE